MSQFPGPEIIDGSTLNPRPLTPSFSCWDFLFHPFPCLAPLQSVRSFLQVLELLRGSIDSWLAWSQHRSASSQLSEQRLCGWIWILTKNKAEFRRTFCYHMGHFGGYTNTNMSFIDIWYLMPFMDSMAMIWINNSESHLLVNSWSWGLSWFMSTNVGSLNIATVGVEYVIGYIYIYVYIYIFKYIDIYILYMFHQPPILCNQASWWFPHSEIITLLELLLEILNPTIVHPKGMTPPMLFHFGGFDLAIDNWSFLRNTSSY